MPRFLNHKEIKLLNFKKVGKNNLISSDITVYGKDCEVGSNVRIDDNVIIKGKVKILDNVHLARGVTLSAGTSGIVLKKFAALSNFVQVFGKSDDYLKPYLPGATLDEKYRNRFSFIHDKKITIGVSTLIGSFSVLLPGAYLGDYSSVGAFMLIYDRLKKGESRNYNFKSVEVSRIRNWREMKNKLLKFEKSFKKKGN